MPIRVYWVDTEQTILRYDFEGRWTWDEFYPAYYEAIAMENAVSHRVDIILDMRTSHMIPANALLHMKNFSEKQPPNVGLSVFVTSNAFVIALYNTASGNGTNAQLVVSKFVWVRGVFANLSSNPKGIMIQPVQKEESMERVWLIPIRIACPSGIQRDTQVAGLGFESAF